MRFIHPVCPKCGGRAVSMLGSVLTVMPLLPDSVNGEPGYEYGTSSEIEWDTEEPLETEHGVQLTCAKGHHWWTRGAPEPPPSENKPETFIPGGNAT